MIYRFQKAPNLVSLEAQLVFPKSLQISEHLMLQDEIQSDGWSGPSLQGDKVYKVDRVDLTIAQFPPPG